MPAVEATHFFYHAALGLEHLHGLNCAHRDVKPDNMLVKHSWNNGLVLVIADYGWTATANQSGLLETPHCITACYRPPEIEVLSEPYAKSCDVWSLGVIARELYTGARFTHLPAYSDIKPLEHAALAGEILDFSVHPALFSSPNFEILGRM